MAYNSNYNATQGDVTKFKIFSNTGGDVDVSGGFVELFYEESVFDTSIRVTAIIIDTGFSEVYVDPVTKSAYGKGENVSSIERLNLSGGEKVELSFSDPNENVKELTLYIDKISPNDEKTNRQVYLIEMCSYEFLNNEQISIRKRYDGPISDSVRKILTEQPPYGLGTEKNIKIDPDTLNRFSFWGNGRKPFYWCTTLAKKAIGKSKGQSAGYMFFENYEGFNFISIDNLFLSDYKKKLIYNQLVDLPPGYDEKILDYNVNKTIQFQNSLMMGIYNNDSFFWNPYNNEYKQKLLDYEEQDGGLNHTGKEASTFLINQEFTKTPSRYFSQQLDIGALPEGETLRQQLRKSKEQNLEYPDVTAQSAMRYNQMMTVRLTITTGGIFDLMVGDRIFCDFPEISSKDSKIPSPKNSGIYMISELCHNVSSTGTYSKFVLIRDSYGR